MTLRRKIVYLIGAHLTDHLHETQRVAKVGIVKMKVRISLEMGYALTIVYRRATNGTMYLIPLIQKKLGQKGTVLTSNTGNQCFFHMFLFLCNSYIRCPKTPCVIQMTQANS